MNARTGWLGIAAAAGMLSGCMLLPGVSISVASLTDPNLQVGAATKLTIEATTTWGRTLTYRAVADRGRIYPDTQTTSKILTYYAPYSSRALDGTGQTTSGDRIQIQVDDGFTTGKVTLPVSLSGNSLSFVQGADANGQGKLALATTDDNGSQIYGFKNVNNRDQAQVIGAEPAVSPDGRYIAYVEYAAGSQTSAIKTVDSSGRVLTVVPAGSTGYNLDPTWDPSSHELVFASDRDNNQYDLFRVSAMAEGNSVVPVTRTAVNERYPSWNPSITQTDRVSTLLVSTQMNTMGGENGSSGGAWNLFLWSMTQGRYIQQLTQLSDIRDYALEGRWHPNGLYVAYTYNGPIQLLSTSRYQRIFVQDVSKQPGSGVQLNRTETDGSLFESNPVWSESGNTIAYLHYLGVGGGAATANVWRQTLNGPSGVSTAPLQWADFTSYPIPAMWFQATQRQPYCGTALGWN